MRLNQAIQWIKIHKWVFPFTLSYFILWVTYFSLPSVINPPSIALFEPSEAKNIFYWAMIYSWLIYLGIVIAILLLSVYGFLKLMKYFNLLIWWVLFIVVISCSFYPTGKMVELVIFAQPHHIDSASSKEHSYYLYGQKYFVRDSQVGKRYTLLQCDNGGFLCDRKEVYSGSDCDPSTDYLDFCEAILELDEENGTLIIQYENGEQDIYRVEEE